jgi:hypothetical protein
LDEQIQVRINPLEDIQEDADISVVEGVIERLNLVKVFICDMYPFFSLAKCINTYTILASHVSKCLRMWIA